MSPMAAVLLARLVTQIELAQLHLSVSNMERAQEYLAEAERIAGQIREAL